MSVDSVFAHKAFAEKMGGITFPMLSDFYPHGAVCEQYDCLRPQGFPKRAVFIIALGYVHRDCAEPGSAVTIAHGPRKIAAAVHALPFRPPPGP